MSLTTASQVWCDQNCINNITIATEPEYARQTALQAGWAFRVTSNGVVDYCPSHKGYWSNQEDALCTDLGPVPKLAEIEAALWERLARQLLTGQDQ